MKRLLAAILIILLVFIIGGMFYAQTNNKLDRCKTMCDESWKKIDAEFQKKSSLIPSFLAMMKDYTVQERDIIQYATDVYTKFASTKNKKISSFYAVDDALSKLLSVVDKYPELKANENFTPLMDKLKEVEKSILKASRQYNKNVEIYNALIKSFPANIIAKARGFSAYPEFSKEESVGKQKHTNAGE